MSVPEHKGRIKEPDYCWVDRNEGRFQQGCTGQQWDGGLAVTARLRQSGSRNFYFDDIDPYIFGDTTVYASGCRFLVWAGEVELYYESYWPLFSDGRSCRLRFTFPEWDVTFETGWSTDRWMAGTPILPSWFYDGMQINYRVEIIT